MTMKKIGYVVYALSALFMLFLCGLGIIFGIVYAFC